MIGEKVEACEHGNIPLICNECEKNITDKKNIFELKVINSYIKTDDTRHFCDVRCLNDWAEENWS